MKNTYSSNSYNRRSFLKLSALAGAGIGLSSLTPSAAFSALPTGVAPGKRIGIIGLDTSHSEVFSKLINSGEVGGGYKVVAAFAEGSKDIPEALKIKETVLPAVRNMGIKIVDSIDDLLKQVDVVLLETIDGRPHYEQALPVLKAGKRMFIDKPIGANLSDAKKIFAASRQYKSPIFSSSALRFDANVQKVVNNSIGKVLGADVYTPAGTERGHLDLAWYGIHGVEMLFTVMGPGCKKVTRIHQEGADLVTGVWEDGRIGTVRGIKKGASNIAGVAFGESGIAPLGPFSTYVPLVQQIINFFETGVPPVTEAETLEIFAFMEAADESKRKNGQTISL